MNMKFSTIRSLKKTSILGICLLTSLLVMQEASALIIDDGGTLPPPPPLTQLYYFTFSSTADNGYGTLTTTPINSSPTYAINGELTVTTGAGGGVYSLVPTNPPEVKHTGAFFFDNAIYPISGNVVDGNGLLFTNNSGKAVNIFYGLDIIVNPPIYSFYVYDPNNSTTLHPYIVSNDGVTLNLSSTAAPIPAAIWLFASALVGLVGISRRK